MLIRVYDIAVDEIEKIPIPDFIDEIKKFI
jgi:hypothetical protein